MHPISSIRRQYLVAWFITIQIYTAVLVFVLNLPKIASIVESVLFTTIYFGIGYSYWFVVKYNQPKGKDYLRVLITHMASVTLLLFVIIGGLNTILELLFAGEIEYLSYLEERRTWKIIAGLSFFIATILFYYLTLYYTQIEESRSKEIKLEGLVKEAELQALKSQINPHFIFNSLNSINTLIHIKPDKASDMLVKLSQFLRFSLSRENNEMSPLNEELENIQRYLDIEKTRFEERLKIEFDIAGDCKKCTIPSLLLQPLLENAIKFGVYENMEESVIRIHTEKKGKFLFIRISNNFEPGATYKKGSGIGLKNVQERLRLMYRENGLIQTHKTENLFTVELTLPQ
jgi:sensor histidine kinase YesM